MSKLSLPHALSVTRRNAAMYRRTWVLSILPNFFEPVFYLWSIGLGVGAYVSQMRGVSYVEFLVPGLICVSAMNGASFEATYNVFVRMTYEKSYTSMLTTPVEPEDILVGELLWALVRACIYGGIFLLVALVFGLATPLQALRVLPVIPLSGLLFAALGLAFTLRIGSIDLFSYYFTMFLTPLFLFSDVFFPLEERLHGVWLQVAESLPLFASGALGALRVSRRARRRGAPRVGVGRGVHHCGVALAVALGAPLASRASRQLRTPTTRLVGPSARSQPRRERDSDLRTMNR